MQKPETTYITGKQIAGLDHIPQYLSPELCDALIQELRERMTNIQSSPFGSYGTLNAADFGPSAKHIEQRLIDDRLIAPPDFLQMNIYGPGQGIAEHIDGHVVGTSAVCTLQSSAAVQFRMHPSQEICTELLVRRGDVYTIKGIVRKYSHRILDGTVDWHSGVPYPRVGSRIAAAFVRKPD